MSMMGKVRRVRFREGKSVRKIARLTSLARNTVRAWREPLEHLTPTMVYFQAGPVTEPGIDMANSHTTTGEASTRLPVGSRKASQP